MHYLFINGRFPQYSQTFVHDQIKAVSAENGACVTVFARSRTPFRFEASVPECDQRLLYGKPFDRRFIARVVFGTLLHPLRAARLVWLRSRKKIDDSTLFLGLQLAKTPQIAITHFGNNYVHGANLKKYIFPKMKNVIVFHGHDVSSYLLKHGWENYQGASRYIDCAICVNRIWADLIEENTSIPDIRTIYLGTEIYPLIRRRNGDTSTYSILFAGRFVQKKGFDILYKAVKNLCVTARWKLRVHCVGDGPLFNEYKRKAAGDGLNETFVFYGSRQKSFVQRLMAECDLIVVPSKTAQDGDSEGLPVVLMEAMVAGIPIISTCHSGIPELITSNSTGILVPENDIDSLEKAIAFAVTNPDVMREMAERAYMHVCSSHDEMTQVRRFVEAIKEIA